MQKIIIIDGENFSDHRGSIASLNNFHFNGVKRSYFIHHPDTTTIRGWHGHQHERKWFYCVHGAFELGLIAIDNFQNPSETLIPNFFQITAEKSRIICCPAGYASHIQATQSNSVLMVLSDKILEEALGDSYRYDASLWINNRKENI